MLFTRFKQILGILAAFLAVISCEAVSVQANLNVTPKSVSVGPEGGTYTVAFTASAAWETTVTANWIHVTPEKGESGDITITIKVDPNTTTEPRSSGVQISAPELKVTETVVVSQEGKEAPPAAAIALSEESSTRPYSAGSAIIEVNANRDWTATSNADWLTPEPATGKSGQTRVTLKAQENNTDLPRVGVVTFLAETAVKTYTLTQEARPAASIELSAGSQLFAAEGGEYSMIVTANRPWTAKPDASWVSVEPASGEAGSVIIKVKASANTEYQNRTATVEFAAGEDAKTTMVVTQLAVQKEPDIYVRVSTPELTVPAAGGVVSVNVTSNGAWTGVSSESWVAISPAEGVAGISEVSITVAESSAAQDREAILTFTARDAITTVKIIQKARIVTEDPVLDLSTKTIALPADASQSSFTIMTNRAWTLSSQASWIHPDITSGEAGSVKVTFTADANASELERSGKLYVSAGGLTAILTVTQEGKEPEKEPQVDLSVLSISFKEEGGTSQATVISDTPWTASCNAQWVSFTPNSGNAGSTTIQVTVQANNTSADRTADIVITAGATSVRLTISQKAKDQQGMGGITGDVKPWDDGGEAGFHKE